MTQTRVPVIDIAPYFSGDTVAQARVVDAVREDEAGHRDRNHKFADQMDAGEQPTGSGK